MQLKMEEDGFVERPIFADEATCHISGMVNRHSVHIWGTEQPHAQIEDFFWTSENWLLPQLDTNYDNYILQLDGAPPPPIFTRMFECFSSVFRRAANGDNLLPWPPCSPDLTQCDFFFWGFVKDNVYVPPLPTPIQKLCDGITPALQAITVDMLHRVCDEFDYRVTQGAHTEGL
jgi:hypothetical protein